MAERAEQRETRPLEPALHPHTLGPRLIHQPRQLLLLTSRGLA